MLFADIQTQQHKACYRRVDLELRDNRLITSTIILLCFPFTFYFVSFPIFYQIDLFYVFPFFTLPLCNWEIIYPISIFLMTTFKTLSCI